MPHVAVAAKIALGKGKGRVAVETWFCPGTMANLGKNPLLSLVIWDANTDQGHQLLGRMEKVEDLTLLDGYTSRPQGGGSWPQAERRLSIRVEKALRFQRARHTPMRRNKGAKSGQEDEPKKREEGCRQGGSLLPAQDAVLLYGIY